MVAVAAGVAGAAEAAGGAEAAAVAAVAVAAVCLGALAASAKSDHVPVALTDRYWPGSTWSTRPIHVFFACGPHKRGNAAAHDGQMGSQPC